MTLGAIDSELVTAASMGAGGVLRHMFVTTDETVAVLVRELQRAPAGHDTFIRSKGWTGTSGGGAVLCAFSRRRTGPN